MALIRFGFDGRACQSDRFLLEHIDRYVTRWRERGYIRESRLARIAYDSSVRLSVTLSNGEQRQYALGDHELAMGSTDALRYWLDTVDRDIRARCVDTRIYNSQINDPRVCIYEQDDFASQYLQQWQVPESRDPKADKRAADLFLMAAGKEAFDTLQSGKPLPITGSKGTAYTLHKRASYCVERVKDNARLCAVVPGVPLWDHLLGIKLMVEHDEAKFLATANVAHA